MGSRAAPGEDAIRGRTPRREQLMSIEYTPSPLLTASRTTPTVLWNDSADPDEMKNFGEFFNNQVENASSIILRHVDYSDRKSVV